MFDKSQRSTFPYWFAHWCAFNMTALNLHRWRFKYLFHDLEKPFIRLFFKYPTVQKFHRAHNRHHLEWVERKLKKNMDKHYNAPDYLELIRILDRFDAEGAVIDWECARFTKSEQPLNAIKEFNRLFSTKNRKHFLEKYPCISEWAMGSPFTEQNIKAKIENKIKELGL